MKSADNSDPGRLTDRAALAAVLFALGVIPLAYLPSPGADMWSELFRRGVLGAGIVIALSAVVFAGRVRELFASPLAGPLAAVIAVQRQAQRVHPERAQPTLVETTDRDLLDAENIKGFFFHFNLLRDNY